MQLLTRGVWYLRSETDPRWNSTGEAQVGAFVMPDEVDHRLEELKIELGEPPDDLTCGYMKD